ncbi:permease prefix domain 2-containing transporter [Ekhidna sp.]|uniref:permease prefix domain 2-containing transporter n=1 Tax=Ekhidna sp. TaxID=2608089 RepID=UPI003B5095CF
MDKKPKLLSTTSKFLERFCKPSIVEGIIGDLEEAFYENKDQKGLFRAKVIHLFQVIGFLSTEI